MAEAHTYVERGHKWLFRSDHASDFGVMVPLLKDRVMIHKKIILVLKNLF